ncbi:MAG: thioesterase family protein, partial [Acidimicrobiia bacterium]|nr:thioesterase family protein [Acidimicrobiia bacterium]
MSTVDAVADLIATVLVEPAGPDRYVGRGSRNDGVDATFGGHFLGQAVSAAQATVEPERRLHSLHAYFLRGGRPGQPYIHQVERVRDGRSFCTRRVRTSQGDDGPTQFELTASFAVEEGGPSLAADPPPDFARLPRPDSLPTHAELMAGLDPLPLPADWALRDYGLDLRTVEAPWRPAVGVRAATRGIRLWLR